MTQQTFTIAEAEKAIAQHLEEASLTMNPRAMEMYRLNVLERLGREEGSQIVIYGDGRAGSADGVRDLGVRCRLAAQERHEWATARAPHTDP